MYQKYIKRIIDIIVSAIAIPFLLPVWLVIAIAIKMDSKGPIFFNQERIGKDKKPFKMFKFRSMNCLDYEMNMDEKHDYSYTRVGNIIRKVSVDETPQFLNVLKGDMSLIGPRPDVQTHVNDMTLEHLERHVVVPGITGLAQTDDSFGLDFVKTYDLDVEYVKNIRFNSDFLIALKTAKYAIGRNNAMRSKEQIEELWQKYLEYAEKIARLKPEESDKFSL